MQTSGDNFSWYTGLNTQSAQSQPIQPMQTQPMQQPIQAQPIQNQSFDSQSIPIQSEPLPSQFSYGQPQQQPMNFQSQGQPFGWAPQSYGLNSGVPSQPNSNDAYANGYADGLRHSFEHVPQSNNSSANPVGVPAPPRDTSNGPTDVAHPPTNTEKQTNTTTTSTNGNPQAPVKTTSTTSTTNNDNPLGVPAPGKSASDAPSSTTTSTTTSNDNPLGIPAPGKSASDSVPPSSNPSQPNPNMPVANDGIHNAPPNGTTPSTIPPLSTDNSHTSTMPNNNPPPHLVTEHPEKHEDKHQHKSMKARFQDWKARRHGGGVGNSVSGDVHPKDSRDGRSLPSQNELATRVTTTPEHNSKDAPVLHKDQNDATGKTVTGSDANTSKASMPFKTPQPSMGGNPPVDAKAQ